MPIVEDSSFVLHQNEILGIVGESGFRQIGYIFSCNGVAAKGDIIHYFRQNRF
jgi:ABC-type phosphonate transport system ATPase subunit